MKRTSIIVAAILAASVTTISLTISSCNDNASDPMNPGVKGGGGKEGNVLNESTRLVAVDRNGIGGSGVSFNQLNAALTVDNFTGDNAGLSSVPDNPGNVWSQDVEGEWPASGNGGIRLRSLNGAIETSTLDIEDVTAADDDIEVTPNFTGNPPGANNFSLVLYTGTTEIGRVNSIPVLTPIIIRPLDCCRWLNRNRFIVNRADGRCVWQLLWNRCCRWRVFWGAQSWDVDRVDFVEGDPGGAYPYHDFTEIQVRPINGGLASSLTVTSEFVSAVP